MSNEWNGVGLPPVGTICKLAGESEHLKPLHPEWEGREVKVYAHFTSDRDITMAAFVSPDHMIGGCGIAAMFKPLRTPEQIAADERLHKIRNAFTSISKAIKPFQGPCGSDAAIRVTVEAMIDAGYRKTEGGAA